MSRSLSILPRLVSAALIGLTIGLLFNRYVAPGKNPPTSNENVVEMQSALGGMTSAPSLGFPVSSSDLPAMVAELETAPLTEIRRFLDRVKPTSKAIGSRAYARPSFTELTPTTRALHGIALKRWFSRDPASAWRYVIGRSTTESTGTFWIDAAIGAWSEVDPHAAAAALRDPAFPKQWSSLAEGKLIESVCESDPELALSLARQHGLGTASTYSSIFGRLAESDLNTAAQRAEDLPAVPASTRSAAIEAVALKWAHTDAASSLKWLTEQPTNEAEHTVVQIVRSWAESAPEEVVKQLDTLAPVLGPFRRNELLGFALAEWAQRDSQAPLAWLEENHATQEEFDALQRQLIENLSREDPEAAAALASKVVAAGADYASSSFVDGWAREDPKGALAWAQTLPRGKHRDDALVAALNQVSGAEPQFLLETFPSLASEVSTDVSWGLQTVFERTVQSLNPSGLDATRDWIDQFPETFRRGFFEEFADQWALYQPEKVLDYLLAQPIDKHQVSAVQRAIHHWARFAPEEAAERVMTFQDLEMRQLAAKNIASVWSGIDEAATREWLTGLPDSDAREAGESALNDRMK